jgi:hypothetical protein
MKKLKKIIAGAVAFTPMLALAAGELEKIVDTFGNAIKAAIPFLFALITVVFLWGIIQYILAGGDEEKRKNAKQLIIYAIIGMFVATAIWGIIAFVGDIFGVETETGTGTIPKLPGT